ncbi:MAG TPA: hypothetical protein VFR88_12665 [Microlunatus sp.]|nr:hypothetical protein [Microlunatus sp.]
MEWFVVGRSLLGFDPAATRADWNNPAIAGWHFRRAGRRCGARG